jgi:hypothetical protein
MKIKPVKPKRQDNFSSAYPFESSEKLTMKTKNHDCEVLLRIDGPEVTIVGDDFDTDSVFFQQKFNEDLEAIAFVIEMPVEFTSEWLSHKGFIDRNVNDEVDTEEKVNHRIQKWFNWKNFLVLLVILLALYIGFKFGWKNLFYSGAAFFIFWFIGGYLYQVIKSLLIFLDEKIFIHLWEK